MLQSFLCQAYENLTVSFHSERLYKIKLTNDSQPDLLCHTVTLHFAKVDEGVTGDYTCKRIQFQMRLIIPSVYIYGGSGF